MSNKVVLIVRQSLICLTIYTIFHHYINLFCYSVSVSFKYVWTDILTQEKEIDIDTEKNKKDIKYEENKHTESNF